MKPSAILPMTGAVGQRGKTMARLIDADALVFSRVRLAHKDGTIGGYNAVVMSSVIKNAPTIDAVPVRHGHWIKEFENEDGRNLRCSECRMVFYVGKGRDGNYCPNCGCRMDG